MIENAKVTNTCANLVGYYTKPIPTIHLDALDIQQITQRSCRSTFATYEKDELSRSLSYAETKKGHIKYRK